MTHHNLLAGCPLRGCGDGAGPVVCAGVGDAVEDDRLVRPGSGVLLLAGCPLRGCGDGAGPVVCAGVGDAVEDDRLVRPGVGRPAARWLPAARLRGWCRAGRLCWCRRRG